MTDDLFGRGNFRNVLPYGGEVSYLSGWCGEDALGWYDALVEDEEWRADVVKMFGKEIVTGRKVIWYGDEGCCYTYYLMPGQINH